MPKSKRLPLQLYGADLSGGCRLKYLCRLADGSSAWLPCRQCVICRARRRECWTGRLEAEQVLNPCGQFWTLTYAPEHLPGEFSRADFRRVIKAFLQRLRRTGRGPARYFAVAELGERKGRLHLHLLLWLNEPAPTRDLWLDADGLWPFGFRFIKARHDTSARYLVSYLMRDDKLTVAWAKSPGWVPGTSAKSGFPSLKRTSIGSRW